MLKTLYDQLTGEREGFLYQARLQSELTIPSLLPPDGASSSHRQLYKPFQSIGAYGVNALANRLTGALYPPTEPFFRLEAKASAAEQKQLDEQALNQIDSELSAIEQHIMGSIVKRGDRAVVTEMVKHLLVSGNAVMYVGENNSRMYSLDEYVAVRDGEGNLLKLIIKDVLSYETFKEANPGLTMVHAKHVGNRSWAPKEIEVYTCMVRNKNMWETYEEVHGITIEGSKRTTPLTQPPYLALRYNRIDGQAYGRGYCENLYGDLRSLENLSKAMNEAAAISARCVFLVNPSGATSMRLFAEADNGDTIPGNAADITTSRVDKGGDLAVVAQQISNLESRLQTAFMLTAAAQRDAERVTATEIRAVIDEVESVLGGAYSILTEEFQRPYISRLIAVLQRKNEVPDFSDDIVDVAIVTGSAGIGRGVDRERLVQFIEVLRQALGPEVTQQYVNVDVALAQLAASFGINASGLIKSPEQMAQEKQEAQQMQMMQQLGPQAIAATGQAVTQQIKGEQNGQPQNPGQNPDQNIPQA